MNFRTLAVLLVLPVLSLTACGSRTKNVDTATYTCAQFNKSLKTKGDDSAGNFINQLVKQSKLSQPRALVEREITAGIAFACHGKPGSTKPAAQALTIAKQLKAGKFKFPSSFKTGKKKSGK